LDLLAVHALSGWDSVSYPFGKGKIKAINLVQNSEVTLQEICESCGQRRRRAADQAAPPDIDVTQYGWKFDNTILTPVAGTYAIAPPLVLQSIAGSCKSASPCANQRCSCNASHAQHTASVVLMTSAQISTHNL